MYGFSQIFYFGITSFPSMKITTTLLQNLCHIMTLKEELRTVWHQICMAYPLLTYTVDISNLW